MKRTALLLFAMTCLVQWFVPSKMIWENEQLYAKGITYKLKTIPVDPNDPFRGKYITLNYDINTYKASAIIDADLEALKASNSPVYVHLQTGEDGFATIDHISFVQPQEENYITARIQWYSQHDDNSYTFRFAYPFQIYFMEESKAPKAEQLYNDALAASEQTVYGLINIKNGKAVLIDVLVDDVSLKELVE